MASKGSIQVEDKGILQVEFANKFVEGGVLRVGMALEDIRFTVYLELALH